MQQIMPWKVIYLVDLTVSMNHIQYLFDIRIKYSANTDFFSQDSGETTTFSPRGVGTMGPFGKKPNILERPTVVLRNYFPENWLFELLLMKESIIQRYAFKQTIFP